MSIELDELRKLPVTEKLRIVEELWDDIRTSDEPLMFSADDRNEVLRRSSEMNAGSDSSLTRAELWNRVNKQDA
ncbi:MAG: addiction module protein [Planctomycetota bacterium]|nr:addiction module protein [Planctomycetota bacterium]MDA1162313.1 addiction module protein [Planctomycetota bacterium]